MRIPALFLLVCLMAGCAVTQSSDSDRALSAAKARVWLAQHLQGSDTVEFGSRNGVSYGADSDAKITFKKGSHVEATIFGESLVTYAGSYSVDRTGAIRLALDGYPGKWPDMRLFPEGGDARLFPANGDAGFGLGGAGSAPGTSAMNSYWPFRFQAQ